MELLSAEKRGVLGFLKQENEEEKKDGVDNTNGLVGPSPSGSFGLLGGRNGNKKALKCSQYVPQMLNNRELTPIITPIR
jgi:hypothetical protein